MKITRKIGLISSLLFCLFILSSSHIQTLPPTSSNLTTSFDNSKPHLEASESIMNQTYYFWNGTFIDNFGTNAIWSGQENYTLAGPYSYSVNEDLNGSILQRDVNDQNRLITNSNNPYLSNGNHEIYWIFTNVSLGDTVLVGQYNLLGTSVDYSFNVSAQEQISLWGQNYTCWKLTDPTNSTNLAYYDCSTGFLINGTFTYNLFSIMDIIYTICMVETNAKSHPNINLVSPSAPTYYESYIPIEVVNSTFVDSVWYRNSTDGGSSWSNNISLNYDGLSFKNASVLHWADATYILQVFANNTANLTVLKTHTFEVYTTGPNIQILSPSNSTYYYDQISILVQNFTFVHSLWYRTYNGTAWSGNSTILYNGTHFLDNTTSWNDGKYHLQVFANDSIGIIAQRDQWYTVTATLPVNLSANLIRDSSPNIVLDSNDVIHAIWIQDDSVNYDIIYSNNAKGYLGDKSSVYGSIYPLLSLVATIDSSDVIHLAWIEPGILNTVYYMNNTGGSFSSPITVSVVPLNVTQIALAADSSSNAHLSLIAYNLVTGNYSISYSNNIGGIFNAPSTIKEAVSVFYSTAIAVESLSIAHVFWSDNTIGNYEIFYSNNSAGSFSTPATQISYNLDVDAFPDIIIDSTNTLHLTWTALLNPSQADIMYLSISSGIISPPTNVTGTPFNPDAYSHIAIDTATSPESIYLTWLGYSGGRWHPFISDNREGSFSTPRVIYDPSDDTSWVEMVVHPYEGLSHFIWSGNDTNDLEIFYSQDYSPIALISPKNITYSSQNIPVNVLNSSRHLSQIWCRNRTSSGSWSSNYTLTWDGTYFSNSTTVFFPFNSSTIIQVFSNDSMGRTFSLTKYLSYDGIPPTGLQWSNTTSINVQTSTPIWINGSAWDPAPGTGISSVTILSSNTTGGPSDWSVNIGTSSNFAFYNTSPIADNHLGELYEIQVSILDGAGNTFILSCNVTIELQPPYGSQDPLTDLSHPQRGDANSYIWVNGTAFDEGFGVANVTVQASNHTGWSSNQGTLNAWAFYNTTPITPDGVYEMQVNVTDQTNKSTIIPCYIWVDTGAPVANQWANTSPTVIQKNNIVWINGSYSDPFPSSGIQALTILQSNTSGGITDWSADVGGAGYFAFYNTSPLLDNQLGGVYVVNLSVIDNADNYINVTCKLIVEIQPPSASQSLSTSTANPQRGDANSNIWVNGTASDNGFGLKNVTIQSSNHTGWSVNQGSLNTWAFYNTTPVTPDGIYEIQINITDYADNSILLQCYISVDTTAPGASQWANTTSPVIQDTTPIWINASYADPFPSSGIQAITILQSNTSGGVSDWSANVGTGRLAFYNTSPLSDNQFNEFYEVNISIVDNAGNSFLLVCRVTVEINFPYGNQDPATVVSNPQTGQTIWVNGSAFDNGFGVQNVTIESSDHSGWSANQGTLSNWAFHNSTPIAGGTWWILINITDHTNKSTGLYCFIYVDLIPPSGAQSASTNLSFPQNAEPAGAVWVNGTASDGFGVGMLDVIIASTNTSASWSLNLGTNESWAFTNTSALNDGLYEIIITLTDLVGNSANITCYIQVDTLPPSGLQDVLTQLFQTTDQNGCIWINGTATDAAGSGLLEVVYQSSNTSASWSANQNTPGYWAFCNTSPLSDGFYQINLRITDRANHSTIIIGYIQVDISSPTAAQDSATLQPQKAANGWIWVNGTASDSVGVGLLDVTVVATTHAGSPWSSNLGTNASWSFNNISAISDGNWELTINLRDLLGNSRNITCYIIVDTTPPQGSQDSVTPLPQTTDQNGAIWINGTGSDGIGIGILIVTIVDSNSSASWTANVGTNTSWAFSNITAVGDGIWNFTVMLVDLLGNTRNITCTIFVDTIAPIASQDPGTNSSVLQETTQIWVNGTASDGPGSGLLSVSVVIGSGNATNTWSPNQGTNASWVFSNSSAISSDQIYWILVNISDLAGNSVLLNCNFRVELNPPQGAQDAATQNPQNGTALGLIWINGSAFDGGSGVKNVSVYTTNITGGANFSTNLGTPANWAFSNTTLIPDGVWAITITIFDNADHVANITGVITVDTLAPTQPNASHSNPSSNAVLLSWAAVTDNTTVTYFIYRNGTIIGNTTTLSYLDSGLSPAVYLYNVIPVDAAGNVGPSSTTVTVTITTDGSGDNWWWIIIVFGIVGVSVSAVAIRRQRKSRSPRPSREVAVVAQPPADKSEVAAKIKLEDALKGKAEGPPKKTGLGFFMIEDETLPEEPEIMMEAEEEPPVQPSAPSQKPAVTKEATPQPKVVHFTFYCPKCNKWYGLKEFAEVDCPICQEPLKLAYTCPTCKKKFMVKEPGMHKCPTDGTQLIP